MYHGIINVYKEAGYTSHDVVAKLRGICKQKKIQDDNGRILFSPDVPGNSFSQKLPYYFDEVFAFRMMKNSEGVMTRYIQTYPDERYDAKDRSGNLSQFEEPDISKIIAKI